MAATVDTLSRSRESLPPILNLDFDKRPSEYNDQKRVRARGPEYASLPTASINSPTPMYSGPPPPYSSAPASAVASYGMVGGTSSPQSTSQRAIRDEKETSAGRTSLPSLSEALAFKNGAQVFSTTSSVASLSQLFGDAPKGPGNPFSQPKASAALLNAVNNSTLSTAVPDSKVAPSPLLHTDHRASWTSLLTSPAPRRPDALTRDIKPEPISFKSPFAPEYSTGSFPFADVHTSQLPTPARSTFTFEQNGKFDDSRNPFKSSATTSYGDTVKRHMDLYEAELSLHEIVQLSTQIQDSSQKWNHKYQQMSRTSHPSECLPDPSEIDDMIRSTHHVLDHLVRLRDTSVVQQTLAQEQQARHARGTHHDDDYATNYGYDAGALAGGDAKKRRGKAAPPGRCHSCNRAETPEWRRGPDGARTLCNACGLHYAKLTRKIGATRAASLTGSNLRPKSLHDTRA